MLGSGSLRGTDLGSNLFSRQAANLVFQSNG
jgi:hypothetical protein